MKQKLKVVNIFGGPGSSKSTAAADLFVQLKRRHMQVELVTEFPKDLIWQERFQTLRDDQLYVFGEQNHRLHRLRNKVDYAITDTSLLLGQIYGERNSFTNTLDQLILEVYNTYNNINFFIQRPTLNFSEVGRMQDHEESLKIDERILGMLNSLRIPFSYIQVGSRGVNVMEDFVVNDYNVTLV